MPNLAQVLEEIQSLQDDSRFDIVRRKYIKALSDSTDRNVICYYTDFLHNGNHQHVSINDDDKNGFMAVVNGMDRTKGLDLFLHTPGGSITAAESLVYYLKKLFNGDIRAIVPQMSMSAGTMIACACKEIVMVHHSSIGPFDPHIFGGLSAYGILEELKNAIDSIQKEPSSLPIWQTIISRYPPTIFDTASKAIQLADDLVTEWLKNGMLKDLPEPRRSELATAIVKSLNNRTDTKDHSRHIHAERAIELGLRITQLEDHPQFQDAVLTVHHCCTQTLFNTPTVKLIEGSNNQSFIRHI